MQVQKHKRTIIFYKYFILQSAYLFNNIRINRYVYLFTHTGERLESEDAC